MDDPNQRCLFRVEYRDPKSGQPHVSFEAFPTPERAAETIARRGWIVECVAEATEDEQRTQAAPAQVLDVQPSDANRRRLFRVEYRDPNSGQRGVSFEAFSTAERAAEIVARRGWTVECVTEASEDEQRTQAAPAQVLDEQPATVEMHDLEPRDGRGANARRVVAIVLYWIVTLVILTFARGLLKDIHANVLVHALVMGSGFGAAYWGHYKLFPKVSQPRLETSPNPRSTSSRNPSSSAEDRSDSISRSGLLHRLRELAQAHREGLITDDEFYQAKTRLLGS